MAAIPFRVLTLLYPRTSVEDIAFLLGDGAGKGLAPWAYAQNALRQERTRPKREREALTLYAEEAGSNPADALEQILGQEVLTELDPQDRQTLLLSLTYPAKEIADRLGLPVRTVEVRILRAREKLINLF